MPEVTQGRSGLLDGEASRMARDLGVARVSASNLAWMDEALEALRQWSGASGEFAIEDFRDWWIAQGRPQPTRHNAWGALGRIAVARRIIEPVGMRPARSRATHAHPVRTYVAGG